MTVLNAYQFKSRKYSSLQYVNKCCESVSERKHKRKKMKIMLVYAFWQNFLFSTTTMEKIIENRCYVSRKQLRIFNLLAKLLKTTELKSLRRYIAKIIITIRNEQMKKEKKIVYFFCICL